MFVDQRARLAVPDVAFDPKVDPEDPAFVPVDPTFVPVLVPVFVPVVDFELPSDGSKMPAIEKKIESALIVYCVRKIEILRMRLPATVETDSAAVEILRTLCRY